MHTIVFTAEELALVHELISARLTDIRREIHHTDNREFKAFLAHREDVLADLLARLTQPEPAGA
jgi:hypothetical protein